MGCGRPGYITCSICSATKYYSHVQRRFGQFSCEPCSKFMKRFLRDPKKFTCFESGQYEFSMHPHLHLLVSFFVFFLLLFMSIFGLCQFLLLLLLLLLLQLVSLPSFLSVTQPRPMLTSYFLLLTSSFFSSSLFFFPARACN